MLLLYGGWNAERAVSLSSTPDIVAALKTNGYEVITYDFDRDLICLLTLIKEEKPDVVFNNVYGRYGEDGHVQGALEIMGIPYTHSGLYASAAAMFKPFTQMILRAHGIPVAPHTLEENLDPTHPPQKYPFVLKPCDEGSSIGVGIIRSDADYKAYIKTRVPEIRYPLMAETYIPGTELSVVVLEGKAYGIMEIRPTKEFYDYTAKYIDKVTAHIYPAEIPTDIYQICLSYGEKAYAALRCQGLARVDIRFDTERGSDGIFVLEVNPQPGLTSLSIAPEVMENNGMSFPSLVKQIVEGARCPG